MKKSVISAVGSSEISGASRWLAALEAVGARPITSASTARLVKAEERNLRMGYSFYI
jgi:hypothetical protein